MFMRFEMSFGVMFAAFDFAVRWACTGSSRESSFLVPATRLERKRVLVLETTRRRSGLTQHVCSSAAPTHAQFAHLH